MALKEKAGAMVVKRMEEKNSEIDDDTLQVDLQRAVERATNRLENRALSLKDGLLPDDELALDEIDVDVMAGFLN